ncbi:hypothetical protein [Rhodocyclus tenuis]|uniref:Secretion system X translation initiation factor n=1 Tax=Rhodocyclus tenuis TaxID=1066 RepID=A0A840GL37_RHOTE|nr:hypothetical protein [Rhodocyclus tenuis]MBB4249142.1 hypothetical protein [Rhodocyclus tenuis]
MITMNRRQRVIAAVLLATLVAALLSPDAPDDELALPPPSAQRAGSPIVPTPVSPVVSNSAPTTVPPLHARTLADQPLGLFAAPPPPAPPVPEVPPPVAAPEPPQVPPLPFRFLGRYRDGGREVVFVSFNDRNLVVGAGDIVEGVYRVQSIAGNVMQLIYLPLQQTQILEIGQPL